MKNMTVLSNGHTAQELEPDLMAQYGRDFTGIREKTLRISPGAWIVPEGYLNFEEKLSNFQFRPDDVVIMTYPKCGTTWTQEIVWTIRNNPDLDNPEAQTALNTRSPFIDSVRTCTSCIMPQPPPSTKESLTDISTTPVIQDFYVSCPWKPQSRDGQMLKVAEEMTTPRTLKTHMPFALLTKGLLDKCKVIYVARNPKDALLSYQHHCRLMKGYGFVGSQDDFVQYFVEDLLHYGSYAEHLKQAWHLRNHPNMNFIFYEDMQADIVGEINKIASFIGVTLTDQQLNNVVRKTSFREMQASDPTKLEESIYFNEEIRKKDGAFFRQGTAGSWRGKFTPEQEVKVDAWIEKNFAGMGLEFMY